MKIKSFIVSVLLGVLSLLSLGGIVYAQEQSTWLPPVLTKILSGDIIKVASNRVRVFFVLMIGAFLLIVIFYIIKGLMDFSRDEAKEIGDAGKIMQKQFIAVAGVFIAVIGVAVILVFFGASIFQWTPHPTCIDNANSYGCWACNHQDTNDLNLKICNACNAKLDLMLFEDGTKRILCSSNTLDSNDKTMTDKEMRDKLKSNETDINSNIDAIF